MIYGYSQNIGQAQTQGGIPAQYQPMRQMGSGRGMSENVDTYRKRLKALGLEDSAVDKMLGEVQDGMGDLKGLKGQAIDAIGKGIGAAGEGVWSGITSAGSWLSSL